MPFFEYDADIINRAQEFGKQDLVFQAILESENLTLTEEESEAIVKEMYGDDEYFQSSVDTYGLGYTNKQAVKQKAVDIALETAKVK